VVVAGCCRRCLLFGGRCLPCGAFHGSDTPPCLSERGANRPVCVCVCVCVLYTLVLYVTSSTPFYLLSSTLYSLHYTLDTLYSLPSHAKSPPARLHSASFHCKLNLFAKCARRALISTVTYRLTAQPPFRFRLWNRLSGWDLRRLMMLHTVMRPF